MQVDADGTYGPARRPTAEEQDEQARGAGWVVHIFPGGERTATCPKCRKPNPAVVADCRAIQQQLLTRPDEAATNPKNGAPAA